MSQNIAENVVGKKEDDVAREYASWKDRRCQASRQSEVPFTLTDLPGVHGAAPAQVSGPDPQTCQAMLGGWPDN
jgi:hypothetical protein